MNLDIVMELIGEWGGTMKFFPSDDAARIGIAKQIAAMAATEDQVEWIVSRLPELVTEWPGMLEVRGIFCTRYRPADGKEAALGSDSPAFAALCPDEDSVAYLGEPVGQRQLSGEVVTATVDPEMQELVRKCAAPKDPLQGVRPATKDDIAVLKAEQDRNRKESAPHAPVAA